MRRIGMTVASVMGAAALALSVAGTATAAQGVLLINGRPHTNPGGCITDTMETVANMTNQTAVVYSEPGCQGEVVTTLMPGQEEEIGGGESVRIN
ncbi:peptidase inhibitor family I36 protein [Streptomyces palmae]|uniref:Secreted protein n=1 Tax=Streptomyces palmae TaxID=1701085 RepID=A0A4Z0GAE0_9ACTN|nr:peptidase inhibitor family I36 protein [Streptomyces palmae]TGA93159.1 hypothetical protein E4099_26875 [Streptomyces palmae]